MGNQVGRSVRQFFSYIPVGGYTSSTQIHTSNYPINLDSASESLHYSLWKPVGSRPTLWAPSKPTRWRPWFRICHRSPTWYTCTYNNGSQITLDMNCTDWATGGGNQFGYLFAQPVGGDGYVTTQGTQPYMNSFPAAALRLGGMVGTANAANMLTQASKALYPFFEAVQAPGQEARHWALTSRPTRSLPTASLRTPQGSAAAVLKTCVNICSEAHKTIADAVLSAPTSPKLAFSNTVACAAWGNAAYDSLPCSDSGHVQDSGSGFTSASPWKFAYQPFALGNNASLPAAIIGGLAPSLPRTVQVRYLSSSTALRTT